MKSLQHKKTTSQENISQKNAVQKKNNPFLSGNENTKNPFVAQRKQNPDLNPEVQAKMETTIGTDFSNVKIHKNSSKATEIGAHAFAQGNDVHFAQGKFDQNSTSGQALIGHEFAHIKQQRNGEVKPNTSVNGVPVNDDKSLEAKADALGVKAAQTKLDNNKIQD